MCESHWLCNEQLIRAFLEVHNGKMWRISTATQPKNCHNARLPVLMTVSFLPRVSVLCSSINPLLSSLPRRSNTRKVQPKKRTRIVPTAMKCASYIQLICTSLTHSRYVDREEGQGIEGSTLAVTHLTQKASPYASPTAITKLAPPARVPVPARVSGCKRKFADDQDVWCNLISPARKTSDIPCVICSSLIRFTY
jgi:hypothetical protein